MGRFATPTKSIVYMLFKGKMTPTSTIPQRPERANFVIMCDYGDWSGFRTLAECEVQFPELERAGKKDGYYWVEER